MDRSMWWLPAIVGIFMLGAVICVVIYIEPDADAYDYRHREYVKFKRDSLELREFEYRDSVRRAGE